MNNNKLLNQIGNLIDNKLQPLKKDLNVLKKDMNGMKQDMKDVKKQLDTVELKIELVNKKVDQSQEETIDVLSELINTGYNLHEKRIRKIEDKLHITNPQ